MRAMDFPCRNRVSTLSCLPVSAWRVGGHWSLTLVWDLGIDGFLPFFSDPSLLYFIKAHCVCLTSGFTTTGRNLPQGAVNSLSVRLSFLSPQPSGFLPQGPSPGFPVVAASATAIHNSSVPRIARELCYFCLSKATAVSRCMHLGSRALETQYCGCLSTYMGVKWGLMRLQVKEQPSPATPLSSPSANSHIMSS